MSWILLKNKKKIGIPSNLDLDYLSSGWLEFTIIKPRKKEEAIYRQYIELLTAVKIKQLKIDKFT